ncbi:MAG: hypothetical protein N2691_01695, partial [Patescibacteria group bacterium]|nr:hypothetical protein [Patescibacteria group bacterium]
MRFIQKHRLRFAGQRAAYGRGGLSMLFQNTLAVAGAMIVLSFLENAPLAQVLLAITSGFAFAFVAPRRHILHGVLPVTLVSLVGLLAYFLSPAGRLGYPPDIALAASLAALGTIAGTAAIAATLGMFLRARIRKTPFPRWFRNLAAVVLVVFIHAQVVMPALSPVLAGETQYLPAHEEFLQVYDPEATYLPLPLVTVPPEPVQRIPKREASGAIGESARSGESARGGGTLESGLGHYPHLSPEEQELIREACKAQGCTPQELKEALS